MVKVIHQTKSQRNSNKKHQTDSMSELSKLNFSQKITNLNSYQIYKNAMLLANFYIYHLFCQNLKLIFHTSDLNALDTGDDPTLTITLLTLALVGVDSEEKWAVPLLVWSLVPSARLLPVRLGETIIGALSCEVSPLSSLISSSWRQNYHLSLSTIWPLQ